MPLTLSISFKEIGRPCSGPITLPWVFKYWSSSAARARALSKNTSDKQFVYPRVSYSSAICGSAAYSLMGNDRSLAERSGHLHRRPLGRSEFLQQEANMSDFSDLQFFVG